VTWKARAGRLAVVLAWGALLAGTIAALGATGRGALSTPPVTAGLGPLRSWASNRDAATILMTGVRVGGRLLAAYLLASTALATLARLTRRAAAVRIADAIALPPIRRLATGAAGLLVVAGPLAGPAGATALTPGPTGPTPVHVAARTTPPAPAIAPPVLVAAGTNPPAPGAGNPPVLVAGTTPPAPGSPGPGHFDAGAWPTLGLLPPATSATAPTRWTVRPGDSLWIIANSVLRTAWGRTPTDEETGRFWVVVVAVNGPYLADPANPNLLFPGQQMVVPPPPPAPAP